MIVSIFQKHKIIYKNKEIEFKIIKTARKKLAK